MASGSILTFLQAGDTIDIQSNVTGVDVDPSVESLLLDVNNGASSGTVKISGDITTTGTGAFKTITLKGKSGVHLGGTYKTLHDAASNNIDIDGPVTLTADLTVDTTANSGTIDFSSTINSEGNETNALTLKGKGGTIKINGIIGGTQNIGALKINDDDANGTGAITLSGVGASNKVGITGTVDVGHTGTTGIDLAGSYYNIDGATKFMPCSNPINLRISSLSPRASSSSRSLSATSSTVNADVSTDLNIQKREEWSSASALILF